MSCCKFKSEIARLPPQTFSPGNFASGIGAATSSGSGIYDVNLLTMTPEEAAQEISTLARQGINLTHLELGNEFYLKNYHWRFPNSSTYMEAALPTIAEARKQFPGVRIAMVSSLGGLKGKTSDAWNDQLRSFVDHVDAVTFHDYTTTDSENLSDVLAYSEFMIDTVVENVASRIGPNLKVWNTEFNYGLSNKDRPIPSGAHGIFLASRQLAAVKHHEQLQVLQMHAFLSESNVDWDSHSGIVKVSNHANDLGAVRVTAVAQIFAHLAHVATGTYGDASHDGDLGTGSSTRWMHPVSLSNVPSLPADGAVGALPCLQAAAFSSFGPPAGTAASVANDSSGLAYVIINRCTSALPVMFPAELPAQESGPASHTTNSDIRTSSMFASIHAPPASARVVTYNASETVGVAPIPADPAAFPWPGPLSAASRTVGVVGNQVELTMEPLTLSVVTLV